MIKYILRLHLDQVPERRDDWSKPAPISKDGSEAFGVSGEVLTLVV